MVIADTPRSLAMSFIRVLIDIGKYRTIVRLRTPFAITLATEPASSLGPCPDGWSCSNSGRWGVVGYAICGAQHTPVLLGNRDSFSCHLWSSTPELGGTMGVDRG